MWKVQKLCVTLAVLAIVTGQVGCSRLTEKYKNLDPPTVALTGLALKDLNPLKPSFLVRLRLDNPNDVDLDLDGADATLALNGQAVAEGVSRSPLVLNRLGSSEAEVEVTANTLAAIQQVAALQTQSTIPYRLTGHLYVVNWLGALGRLPFNLDGTVDREALMGSAARFMR